MAFVPDINGVCSIEGTLEMTSNPTKIERMKTNRTLVSIFIIGAPVSGPARTCFFPNTPGRRPALRFFSAEFSFLFSFHLEFFVHDLAAVRDEAALDDFVVELEDESFVRLVPEFLDQRHEVRGVNLADVQRHTARQVRDADDLHAVTINHLV